MLSATTTISTTTCCAFYMDRLSPREFRTIQPKQHQHQHQPIVVESVIDIDTCEQWMQHMATRSRNEIVRLLADNGSDDETITLKLAMDMAATQSTHARGIFSSSLTKDGSSCSTDQLGWYDVQEDLFRDVDWFPYFAYYTTVSDALLVAGNGGTSELTCHTWTTTYTCLDGNVLWRVLPPECTDDALLRPQPSTPTVWGNHDISVSCTSTRNLFAFRHNDVPDNWSEWTEEEQWYEMQDVAEGSERLLPNVDVEGLYYSTVLTPGDCLVVPPGWWHQSYALEPTMSISSLRCGTMLDAPNVVQTLLSGMADVPESLRRNEFVDDEDEIVQVIKTLFDFLDQMKVSTAVPTDSE
jgi:hypothetical protein